MSKYFVQVGYTAEAWAAMSRGPQRVVERVQASAEALGGSIESLYFCFGDYDLMGVVDFPDSRGVAAWSMAVSRGGDVRAFKTTTLLCSSRRCSKGPSRCRPLATSPPPRTRRSRRSPGQG